MFTEYPTMAFAVIFPFLKMRNLFEIFEDAYQDPAHCGAPRRMLAYGVGYNLFTEFSAMPWCTGLDRTKLRGLVLPQLSYGRFLLTRLRYATMCT